MRLAVGITTMSAASPPETRTKRSRIRRSFSLFSAPPMGMIQPREWPSGTLLGIYLSAFHHELNGAHRMNITSRIALHGNDVGQEAWLEGPDLVAHLKRLGITRSGCNQYLGRRHACRHHQFYLTGVLAVSKHSNVASHAHGDSGGAGEAKSLTRL